MALSRYLAAIMDCGGCHTRGVLFGKPDSALYLAGSEVGSDTWLALYEVHYDADRRAQAMTEIAKLAVYLASEDADHVTGQTFTIDEGLSMNVGQGA